MDAHQTYGHRGIGANIAQAIAGVVLKVRRVVAGFRDLAGWVKTCRTCFLLLAGFHQALLLHGSCCFEV